MRRHDISFFSLISGLVFGVVALTLLVTDGRFTSYDVHWTLIWSLTSGAVGALLVAAAVRAIMRERRTEEMHD